jgi:hypothetical protein
VVGSGLGGSGVGGAVVGSGEGGSGVGGSVVGSGDRGSAVGGAVVGSGDGGSGISSGDGATVGGAGGLDAATAAPATTAAATTTTKRTTTASNTILRRAWKHEGFTATIVAPFPPTWSLGRSCGAPNLPSTLASGGAEPSEGSPSSSTLRPASRSSEDLDLPGLPGARAVALPLPIRLTVGLTMSTMMSGHDETQALFTAREGSSTGFSFVETCFCGPNLG